MLVTKVYLPCTKTLRVIQCRQCTQLKSIWGSDGLEKKGKKVHCVEYQAAWPTIWLDIANSLDGDGKTCWRFLHTKIHKHQYGKGYPTIAQYPVGSMYPKTRHGY